jgi:hypothetical protein
VLLFEPRNLDLARFNILLNDLKLLATDNDSLTINSIFLSESDLLSDGTNLESLEAWAIELNKILKLLGKQIDFNYARNKGYWTLGRQSVSKEKAVRMGKYGYVKPGNEERKLVRVPAKVEIAGYELLWLLSQFELLEPDAKIVIAKLSSIFEDSETEKSNGGRNIELHSDNAKLNLNLRNEINKSLRSITRVRDKTLNREPIENKLILDSPRISPIKKLISQYFGSQLMNSNNEETSTFKTLVRTGKEPLLFERWVQIRLLRELEKIGFEVDGIRPKIGDFLHFGMTPKERFVSDPVWLNLIHRNSGIRIRCISEPNIYYSRPPGTSHWRVGNNGKIQGDEKLPQKPMAPNANPDFLIESLSHRFEGRPYRWIIDAKYRNYRESLPTDYHEDDFSRDLFVNDILTYALKYRENLQANLSTIIHCSADETFTYWDSRTSRMKISDISSSNNSFQEERKSWLIESRRGKSSPELLSFGLVPGEGTEAHLTSMFQVMFGYHLGSVEYCWSCGGKGRNVATERVLGAAECEECERHWVVKKCNYCKFRRPQFYSNGKVNNGVTDADFCVHCGAE